MKFTAYLKCSSNHEKITTVEGIVCATRLTRGARPALDQVFRGQRRGYGDRWVALTQLTGGCYYGDATVRDSKVWCRGVTPIF